MRHTLPFVKRLIVLVLPCCFAAGSLGSEMAFQACRHAAMHHSMRHHGGPGGGPCWCDDMTGGGVTLQPVVEALPSATIVVSSSIQEVVAPIDLIVLIPDSPSFAPTPPPPNGRPV
jgi:hypothetical protein